MSTKHRKVKRKFLLSMEELKTIDNMMMSNDIESRLLGLSLLETSALGKHYFTKGKISKCGRLNNIVSKLRNILCHDKISLLNDYHFIYYHAWIQSFIIWIRSKTY
jgi:hypothetical protein